MDKANLALARHLVAKGRRVHLIAHRVANEFRQQPNVRIHLAPTPAGSLLLGEIHLSRLGRQVAARIGSEGMTPIVLSNGGNCAWPGVNWVHSLHHAWPTVHYGAPLVFRVKNRIAKTTAIYREARAIRLARLVVTNSHRTKADILRWLPETAGRVEIIYLGSGPQFKPQTAEVRNSTRLRLGIKEAEPVILFVGALSHDNNKGLDVLLDAWRTLASDARWDAKLLVAGGGSATQAWRRSVAAHPDLARSVKILGHVAEIHDLYSASDLLVAPSRYEAYGLAAHEAICSGLPVLISAKAGISELYPSVLVEMILPDPTDAIGLAAKLRSWRTSVTDWPARFTSLRRVLASHSWQAMAGQITELAELRLAASPPPAAVAS